MQNRRLCEATTSPTTGRWAPTLVTLSDARATDVSLTGSKAAALATASVAGVGTLPGVVLTTVFTAAVDADPAQRDEHPALRRAFELAGGDEHPLVARSSSVLEDTAGSSMAGQFDSIIGVSGLPAFVDAVQAVLDSRVRAGAAGSPIAVLVQPLIKPRHGGVLFGVDPVTGRTDRWTVSAVDGGPEPLVSGEVDGSRYLLDAKAKVIELTPRGRTAAVGAAATPPGGPVQAGGDGLRRSPGRGVGGRHRRSPLVAAVPTGDHRDPRRPGGAGVRPGTGRRDVPRAARRARARPVGATAARRGPRGGPAGGPGHAEGGRRQRRRRVDRGPRRDRPPPGR